MAQVLNFKDPSRLTLSHRACSSALWYRYCLPDGSKINSHCTGWHSLSYGPSTHTTCVASVLKGKELSASSLQQCSFRVRWSWAELCQTRDVTSHMLSLSGGHVKALRVVQNATRPCLYEKSKNIQNNFKLATLSAGMWCLLQLPVVHSHLFGLVDVEVEGRGCCHYTLLLGFRQVPQSTSLTVSDEEVGFSSHHCSPYCQEVKGPHVERGVKSQILYL